MSTNPLNLARLVSVILICATLLAACSSGPSGDSGPKPEPLPGTYEQRAWLDKFISHELACRFYFPNFHRNPQAGQEATFDNSLNRDTYRVVWADDLHCIIETKSDARDDICYAYEVAWRGSLAGWVRRAWVGIEGAKAHRANIKEPRLHPSLAQLFSGIKFDFGDGTVEHSSFAGFNYCGRMWSGTLLEASAPGQGTKRTVRISHEAWFSRILMQEWRDGGNSTRTTGMVSCSDNGAALLDWNGVDLPARNEDRQYLDENTRRRHAAVTVYLNSSYEHMQSVRPSLSGELAVGDYARYLRDGELVTHTVVAVTEGDVTVEVSSDRTDVVEAYRIDLPTGDARPIDAKVLEAWIGKRGEQPMRGRLPPDHYGADQADITGEMEAEGEYSGTRLGGHAWSGRYYLFKSDRWSPRREVWRAESAPLGRPIKEKLADHTGANVHGYELASWGSNGKPTLKWP